MLNSKSLILLLVLIFLAGMVLAAPPPPRHPMGDRLIKELKLTAEQQAKFKAGDEKLRQASEGSLKKIAELRDKIEKEMEKEEPDRQALHGYIKEIDQLRTDNQIKRMDLLLDLKKELTPEQKEQFKKLSTERKKGWQWRRPGR